MHQIKLRVFCLKSRSKLGVGSLLVPYYKSQKPISLSTVKPDESYRVESPTVHKPTMNIYNVHSGHLITISNHNRRVCCSYCLSSFSEIVV